MNGFWIVRRHRMATVALAVLAVACTHYSPPAESPTTNAVTHTDDQTQKEEGDASAGHSGASDRNQVKELEREVGNRYSERRHAGPEKPAPKIWFEPAHKLSATGETTLRLVVDNWGFPVDSSLLESLVPLIRLRQAGASQDMEITTNLHIPPKPVIIKNVPKKGSDSGQGTGDSVPRDIAQRAYIEVVPSKPLGSGWHALGLSAVPNSVIAPFDSEEPPSVGAYTVRFNPASAPTPSRIVMCPKGKAWKGVLEFTEPINAPTTDVTASLEVKVDSAKCAWNLPSTQSKVSKSMWFKCGSIATDALVKFGVSAALVTESGKKLSNLAGKETWTQSVGFGTLKTSKAGPGCKSWDL